MTKTLLVTGASGFIGSHTIIELLNHGYNVRGTLRSLDRADQIREIVAKHTENADKLSFVTATLTDEHCWHDAVAECDGIIHIASPVPPPTKQPDNADEIVKPAREGAINVLKAAKKANISRVVMTSSVASVYYNKEATSRVQTAKDWSDLNLPGVTPYTMSKTIAEQTAWDFVKGTEGIELVTVLPSVTLGPALEADYGSSLDSLLVLLKGDYPLLPHIGFGVVDVRDVAKLHRIAFEAPDAANQRLLCSSGIRWYVDVSKILAKAFPDYQKALPTHELPNFVVRLLSHFNKDFASIVNDINKHIEYDCQPAKNLGWEPRPPEEAIIAGGKSLIEQGLV